MVWFPQWSRSCVVQSKGVVLRTSMDVSCSPKMFWKMRSWSFRPPYTRVDIRREVADPHARACQSRPTRSLPNRAPLRAQHVAKHLATLRPSLGFGTIGCAGAEQPRPRSAAVGAKEQKFCGTPQQHDKRKLDLHPLLSPPCPKRPGSGTPAAWDTPCGGTRSKQHMKRAAPRKIAKLTSPHTGV